MRETCVGSLGWEGNLEKGTATHFSALARRIPWTGVLADYSPWGRKSRTRLSDKHSIDIHTMYEIYERKVC